MVDRTYKAIFFDLDGTLLPIDMDLFLKIYFKGISEFAAENGFDGKTFLDAVIAGVGAMTKGYPSAGDTIKVTAGEIDPNADIYNCERFWQTFEKLTGISRQVAEPLFMEFYTGKYCEIGQVVTPNPFAAKIVTMLKEKGYPLYLTTMPLFPLVAVEERLRWAKVDSAAFERITTYENSKHTKPYTAYFEENTVLTGLKPEEILMVGNNTKEDLNCMKTGMDAYLVTDWLLNPNDFDIETVKHGSLEDFYAFVCELPSIG